MFRFQLFREMKSCSEALPGHSGRLGVRAVGVGVLTTGVFLSVAVGHEGDPKRNPEPSIPGDIVRAGTNGLGSGWDDVGSGVVFQSQIPVNALGGTGNGSDLWHHVSDSGREYGIVTTRESVAWVEVTNPVDPMVVHVHVRGATSSLWGDVKTIGHHAYVDGEGGGILVFDMSSIDSGVVEYLGDVGVGSAHNLVACPELGILARCGSSFRLYSVADDPAVPILIGLRADRYVHDAFLAIYPDTAPDAEYHGHLIGFLNDGFNNGGTDTGISIVDFGLPEKIDPAGVLLSRITWPNAGYSHQSYPNDDFRWLYSNDETSNNSTWQCVDISDLNAPVLGETQSNGKSSSNHNCFFRDGRLFAANYKTGLRVLEAEGNHLEEVASFDTYPESDSAGYQGCWGVDPFLPSGTIMMSDMQRGLFVVRLEEEPSNFSYPEGLPDLVASEGATIRLEVDGVVPAAASLEYEFGSGGVGVVPGESTEASNQFILRIPASEQCPDTVIFDVVVETEDGETLMDPNGPFDAMVADEMFVMDSQDGESDAGWSVGSHSDDAVEGLWTQRTPRIDDAFGPLAAWSGEGGCFMTGRGDQDVDGGVTTLVSPAMDPLGMIRPTIRYRRWLQSENVIAAEDRFEVELTFDEGATWQLVDLVTFGSSEWIEVDLPLSGPSSASPVRLRFSARDLGEDSTVVAAVDQLELLDWGCAGVLPGDLNADGRVDGLDFGQFLAAWGDLDSPADFNFDGLVDGLDLGILLLNWTF
jgi:choice-of-anchor B domain-containing protein